MQRKLEDFRYEERAAVNRLSEDRTVIIGVFPVFQMIELSEAVDCSDLNVLLITSVSCNVFLRQERRALVSLRRLANSILELIALVSLFIVEELIGQERTRPHYHNKMVLDKQAVKDRRRGKDYVLLITYFTNKEVFFLRLIVSGLPVKNIPFALTTREAVG